MPSPMNPFTGYPAGDSWPYRLDPRGKLVGLLLYSIAAFLAVTPPSVAAVFLLGIVIWAASGLSWRRLWIGLRPLLALAVLSLAAQLFFSGGAPFYRLGPLTLSIPGAWSGLVVAVRLTAVGGAALFLLFTTRPLELMEAGAYLMAPLKKFRFPVDDLSMLMGLSLRFIPLLTEEAEKISWAQKARGLDWEKGPIWSRLANRSAIFYPLLVSLFRRSEEVAVAMEARGYRRGHPRTSLYRWNWRLADWMVVGSGLALTLFCLLNRVHF